MIIKLKINKQTQINKQKTQRNLDLGLSDFSAGAPGDPSVWLLNWTVVFAGVIRSCCSKQEDDFSKKVDSCKHCDV